MLQKIFPGGVGNSPRHCFKVVFLSEGYLLQEQHLFTGACIEFVERMLGIPPFNLTRINPHWLSVYRLFVPSANAGPASGSSSPGRTAFESAIDPATGVLSVNAARVVAEVTAAQLRVGTAQVPLSELILPGSAVGYTTGTLLVVLLPRVLTPAAGADAEHMPADGEYHFVATTRNGEWHQVVVRGMAAVLGLGDEFELSGTDHLAPADASIATKLPYNLEYFPTPPPTNGSALRWRSLFTPAQLSQPPMVHGKTGAPAAPDVTLPAFPLSPDGAELWEGGGGYRTQVYRTARDCLMRRRCGDPILALRQAPVGFCPACRRFLHYVIG
jgi:hypothetical protein